MPLSVVYGSLCLQTHRDKTATESKYCSFSINKNMNGAESTACTGLNKAWKCLAGRGLFTGSWDGGVFLVIEKLWH